MNKKLLSFLLAFVMLLSSASFSYAQDVTGIDGNNYADSVVSSSAITMYNGSTDIENISARNTSSSTQDIVLVLDDSGSMSNTDMSTLKEASIKFCETILNSNISNRIGVVAFSRNRVFDFSSNIDELKNNINSLYSSDLTPLHTGIISANTLFENSWSDSSVKSMVIMSDGSPDNKTKAKAAYDDVADKYNIYSVYFGNSSSTKSFMESIQNSGFYNATDVDSLIEQFDRVSEEILNPLDVTLSHKCLYNFMTQRYRVDVVIKNPNKKDITNVKVALNIPQEFELDESINPKVISIEKILDIGAYISWEFDVFQDKENKFYDISVDISSNELSLMNVSDQIIVDGYMPYGKELDFSKDVWNFENYNSNSYNIDNMAFEGLIQNMSNSDKESARKIKNQEVGGHCFGMSSTVTLAKGGELSASEIDKNAENIHDISKDLADQTISYYHFIQLMEPLLSERAKLIGLTPRKSLEEIINKVRLVKTGGNPVVTGFNIKDEKLLGFTISEGGGHAVVCYDYNKLPNNQSIDFKNVDGNSYNSRILVYDPNYPSLASYIFCNTSIDPNTNKVTVDNDNFLYVASKSDGSVELAYDIDYFKYGINDLKILNCKDLSTVVKNYSSYLRVKVNSQMDYLNFRNGNSIHKINTNGITDNGKNLKGYFDDNEISSTDNMYYNVLIDNSNVAELYFDNKTSEIDCSMSYDNYYCSASSDSVGKVITDPSGKIQLEDVNSEYSLGLTANEGFSSLPWYTVTVEGTEKAKNPSLKNTGNGYIFEGEELSNIKVTANNDNETKKLTFDSNKTSVLITNEDDNLIVKEDKDGDGDYETPIADSDNKITVSTETLTETTTTATRPSSGGGGSSRRATTTTSTTEATTEITNIEATEVTTEGAINSDVKVTIGKNIVEVGNKTYSMDVAPYIQTSSNSTMVPLRFVALAIIGDDVEKADTSKLISWDATTKTATITVNNKSIEITAGSDKMIVDGISTTMEYGVKAEIKDSRMFIPFRALGKALGVNVDWDADTKTAIYKVK